MTSPRPIQSVVVVGAGIIGAPVARDLAQAGCQVTDVERGPAASGISAMGEGHQGRAARVVRHRPVEPGVVPR